MLAPWCAGMCDVYRYFRVKYVRVPTPCIRWSQAVFAEPWMREFQMKLNQCLQKPTTQHRHWSDRTKQRWKPLEAIGSHWKALGGGVVSEFFCCHQRCYTFDTLCQSTIHCMRPEYFFCPTSTLHRAASNCRLVCSAIIKELEDTIEAWHVSFVHVRPS